MAQALALLSPSLGCLRTMIHPEQTAVCTRRGFPNAGLLSFRLQITWEGELAERGLEGSSDKQVLSHRWGQKLLSSVAGATCKGIPRLSSGSHPPHVPLVWISSWLGECHVLLLIPSGCLAMLGDISGCHHWGWSHHWVIRGPGCSFTPTVCRTDPHDRGGSGPARQRCPGGTPCLPATLQPRHSSLGPIPQLQAPCPWLPTRPTKQAGRHQGFTNFISRLFMFVFCLLLETCRLHVCAGKCRGVQPETHTDPKCPPTRDPHRLAGHRTDSAVLPDLSPAFGLSAHNVHPPTRTDRPSRTPVWFRHTDAAAGMVEVSGSSAPAGRGGSWACSGLGTGAAPAGAGPHMAQILLVRQRARRLLGAQHR